MTEAAMQMLDGETQPRPRKPMARGRRPARRDREGAVMIVVMLVLLTVTALAMFSVQSTTYELRAAGHLRQSMQSQYVAEAAVVSALALVDSPAWGPRGLLWSADQTALSTTISAPSLYPYEPELLPDKRGYRMYAPDFAAFTGNPPVATDSFGARGGLGQPYDPTFTVDINDYYTYTGAMAGQRSDGAGRLQFLYATYTGRGRMRLRAGDYAGTAAIDGPTRTYHEAATDARAYGISGPFAR